jgi:hypothetical protein
LPFAPTAPSSTPQVLRPPAGLAGTSLEVRVGQEALPFASPAAASTPPAANLPAIAVIRAPAALTGTIMGGELPLGPVLPFAGPTVAPAGEKAGAPADSGAPTLTLQQYASLCAELAAFPDRAETVFQRHGLSDPRHRHAVDLGWQERLRQNPAEYQAWRTLYQRWVEHFEGMKRQGGG